MEEKGAITASALIVIDRTAGGYCTWDCPRGPLWTDERSVTNPRLETLLYRILDDAKKDRCMALTVSPFVALPTMSLRTEASPRHEHPQATLLLDLRLDEQALLGQMHPKGRYNIKVARRHGVTVRASDDVNVFFALMQATGERDSFGIGSRRRYDVFLKNLEQSFLLMAYHADMPIAGAMGVRWNETGYYYYGASSSEHRNLMAPYLLQWEAMQLCKAQGCTRYDLLGIDPPARESTWAGVTEFKRKLGGQLIEYPAERMIVLKPWVYRGLRMKRTIFG